METDQSDKPVLQLVGQNGNAFLILGHAKRVARDSGWDKSRITAFLNEAINGDYDHLLRTCMKHFDVQ